MLATSKNVLFPGHNHLLTTGTDDPTLWLSPEWMAAVLLSDGYEILTSLPLAYEWKEMTKKFWIRKDMLHFQAINLWKTHLNINQNKQ